MANLPERDGKVKGGDEEPTGHFSSSFRQMVKHERPARKGRLVNFPEPREPTSSRYKMQGAENRRNGRSRRPASGEKEAKASQTPLFPPFLVLSRQPSGGR